MSILKLESGSIRTAKRQPMVESVVITDENDNPNKETEKHIYQYGCVMLPLNDDISAIVKYWAKKNIDQDNLYINVEEGIDGLEDFPHITAKYGIINDEFKHISDLIEGYGNIDVQLNKVELFTQNPKFDVLKITITGDKLQKLHDILSESNDGDKFPDYKPHLTLAYLKKGTGESLVDNDFFDQLTDNIDQVLLTDANGEDHYIDL